MQMNEANRIREAWGDKPHDCVREELEKEYHLGQSTGDYVCPTCGRTYWNRQIPEKGEKD